MKDTEKVKLLKELFQEHFEADREEEANKEFIDMVYTVCLFEGDDNAED